jgi:hypothetical protein
MNLPGPKGWRFWDVLVTEPLEIQISNLEAAARQMGIVDVLPHSQRGAAAVGAPLMLIMQRQQQGVQKQIEDRQQQLRLNQQLLLVQQQQLRRTVAAAAAYSTKHVLSVNCWHALGSRNRCLWHHHQQQCNALVR